MIEDDDQDEEADSFRVVVEMGNSKDKWME